MQQKSELSRLKKARRKKSKMKRMRKGKMKKMLNKLILMQFFLVYKAFNPPIHNSHLLKKY